MRKIRSLLIYLFVFLAVWVSTPVSAYNSFIANLSTNSTAVKNGDYVEVLFLFEANKDTNEEISAFQATLDYDETIFEEIKQSDFEVLNSWEEFLYNSNNKQFVVINKSGELKEKDVIKLKLKVKNDISITRTSIKFKDIVASNGSEDMNLNDSEVQVDITSQQKTNTVKVDSKTTAVASKNETSPNEAEKNNTTNNIISNEKENNNVVDDNKNNTTNIIEDDSEENTTYKNVNIRRTSLGVLVTLEIILLLLLILLVIIIKKKLSKKDGKLSLGGKLLFVVLVIIIILAQVFVVTKAIGHKGELNGDGEVDYKDVSILEQHLIDLKRLPDNILENADINYDGEITVTDLSLLVKKIEKNLDYYVEIRSSMEDYYLSKNEEINLKFSADVAYGATIEEVTINEETYEVEKLPDTNDYTVKFNTLDKAGVKEFKFTKVKLNVGKEVEVDFTEKIDVLKDQPTIENYRINELTSEAKMQVSFDVKDSDLAFKSSIIEIVEKNSSKVIEEKEVIVGKNEFIFTLEDKKDYIANIYIDYDLDTNTLMDHEKDNSGSLVRSYDLRLNIDYKFEFNNLKTFNSKGEETSVFDKNNPIIIKFNSKNETIYKPRLVKVNDVEYKLSENGNLYEATLNGIGNIGENEIKVQEILLENGKSFNLDKDNIVKLTINKDKPQVENIVIQELEDKLALKIAFKIKDTEQSILKKKIVVKNDKDKIVLDKEFEQLEFEEIYELEEGLSSKYKIEVKADYDLTTDNSNPLKDQVIYTQTIDAKPRINILKSEVSPNTIKKDGEINITYAIESNQNIQIKQLVVNDIKAIATKQKDNMYMVKIPVGNKSGIKELELTKAILENGIEVSINKIDLVEVLKDVPVVGDYQIKEDFDNKEITINFNIKDLDKAFVSGKVQLVKEDKSIQSEEDIKGIGENSFNLSVKEDEKYTFKVILTYKTDEEGNNLVEEEIFLEKLFQLVEDYNLKINDIKTSNDKETQYFNKNEKIKVSFTSTNSTKLTPEKAQINGKEYNLSKLENNRYETTIDGFDGIGVSDITIEKVWMNSTKELTVDENNVVKIEILKIAPTVESFTYEKTEEEEIKVTFNIKDEEDALKKGKLIVKDKNNEIFSTESLKVGENQFTFNRTLSEEYKAEILFDYDLDTNSLGKGQNEYIGQKVLEKTITISNELIELKDIHSVKLYRKNGDNVEEVKAVDIDNFNPSEYLAKVTMKNIPTLYSEIKSGKVVGNEFRLVLKYDNAIQYEGTEKRNEIEVKFGELDNNSANIIEFDELIKRIQENPTDTINLTNDLDASSISVTTATYLENFKGTINGNGHTIKNLSKPLFNQLQNAKIENLIIKNAKLSGSNRGILANSAIGSTITNVHINDSSIETWNDSGTGGFMGTAEDNTVIKESSLSNIVVQSNKFVGGFVGFLKTNSIIENSYITGTVKAGYDAVGGMVGQTSGLVTIKNSYADVTLNVTVTWAAGGLIGYSNGNSVILKNNISLATGGDKATRVIGTNYNNQSDNNYELQESTLRSNVNGNKIKVVSKKDINETFLKTQLNWDNEVWSLTGANGEKMPALNNLDPNNRSLTVKPKNDNVDIPNFERISKLAEYDSKMEIAYHNMHILMPFYDSKYYINYGNEVDENDILNTQKIKSIIAYNKDSKMIPGLDSDNYNSISKIKVIFENDQFKEYTVTFKKMLNDVATYKIDLLDIGYTYNKFVLNKNISLVNEVINKAISMDYSGNIATVTPEEESRLYVDYYNESVKSKINEVVIGILQNEAEYNLYLDNEILKKKVSNELFTDNQLEKLIYTYNYYEKWYNIDIGGIRISDLLYFNSDNLINKEYDIKKLTQNTMSIRQEYRNTTDTVNYYNNTIKPMTNKSLKEFLEYYMKIEGFNNPDEWFTKNFKGIISEKPVVGKESEIDYRAWTLLNKRDNHLLPILTAPQEDMYIITVPTQIFIGSLNRYSQHLNKDIEGMKAAIESYATRLSNFYTTSSSFINDSLKILNSKTHIQYDTRFGFPNTGTQNKGSTQDSVIKWVYEAVDRFAGANGSGAYANGTDVYWVVYSALGGDFNFEVFSHETAHNQDGYYFYEGKWRRTGTWPEDHADANIAQSLNDGSLVFNIRNDFDIEADISNNLTLDRITGKENINSYYKEMFETYYVLDYLTAKAFLQLTPEQQSKLATQANYVNDDNPEDGGLSTNYKALTAEEITNMNLEDIEDLWNNRIVFRGSGTVSGEAPGSYGGDSHYNIYWYQPHNDNGRPDSYSFKRLGFELLGVGGYTNGYVAYRSGMSKNDLEALRIATNNPNITWKEYKIQRYQTVENSLSKIQYFNSDKVIELYKQSLAKDAAAGNRNETNNVRRVLYGMVKRATNDFSDATIYNNNNIIEVSTAEELIQKITNNRMGNYKLKGNLDFSKINVSQKDAYIDVTFLGTLDGNGFKITGLTKPLLNKVTYANVKNITLENSVYIQNETAALIKTAKNSMIEDITISNANISIPIVGSTQGSLQKSGKIEFTVKSNEIKSIEDLLNINNDSTGFSKKMKYKLVNDLDFSSQNITTAVITGEFLGSIDGNGHTISNLNVTLFENLKGNVSNLNLNNVTVGNVGADMIGAIAKVATNAVISNIKIDNIAATAHHRVGSVVGVSTNTEYKKVSVTNAKIKSTGFYGGGLIGRSQGNTTIQDVAVSGTLNISDTSNGGLIGAIKNGDTINRAYVDIDIIQDNDKDVKNGGLYGVFEGTSTISISSVVVVGEASNKVYKITPQTNDTEKTQIANYLSNVYEKQGSITGISNSELNTVIKLAKEEDLKNETFYTNILSWPTEVWNFSDLENGSGPRIN
ncbi:ZmpA/ZmpB/ZmpC family metallo-endopeptidase [uncultured Clostridium sp.]|uniref:ZmpA/ZmpB/ZmpC family metallo-endopeptidase-related protein n=1 Tax=uncultured Clostridium sp. TaxID=59620 RepID=UPI0025EE5480|nr:ZmpA/ZmpB/ZmpC family metallo-endopeptidase [uncultured Clostridium sp.]